MIMSDTNFFSDFVKKFQEEMKGMGHANLVIAGKTGVGKSTLINSAFREKIAEVGIGKPVTDELHMYEKENYPLRLYDTVGFELNPEKQEKTIESIKNIQKQKGLAGLKDEFIHGLWYCVLASSNRLELQEYEFINSISESMPVVVVLTQSISKKKAEEFKNQIFKDYPGLKAKNIIVTLAEDYIDDDDEGHIVTKPAFGVDQLCECTLSLLPESAQKAWINAQKASIQLKHEKANKIVLATAAASFGEGYIPVPFSDCAVLIPTQIAMIAAITAIYGVNVSEGMIKGFVTSLVGTAGATFAGKTIVSTIFKLIPVVGTAIGGTISGTTAALLTTALGKTYMKMMEMTLEGEIKESELNSEKAQKKIREIFDKEVRN